MTDAGFPAGLAALAMAGVVLFAMVKIAWGVALWFKPSRFRLGQQMQTEPGTVQDWSGRNGFVDVGGELWRAESKDELKPGDAIRVSKVKGLTLEVKKG
ncbi:MAG: hypothetical protein A3E78_07970 [Alphaproteobacteria bacterium RIFCSPHIGHO2_12_FULL_63_12]|nr:MAG: hypothetical protein A3E78_07970 [Alphaproteobacteria bacterium RIFCSPHIGHO2_12_FULL_63_12]